MLKYYHCLQRNQKPRKALLHLACEVFCLRKTVKDGIILIFMRKVYYYMRKTMNIILIIKKESISAHL